MKNAITITTLALTLILSAGCNTTTPTPTEHTNNITDKPIVCEIVGMGRELKHSDLIDLLSNARGKRIIYSTIGTICFQ